MDLAEGIQQQGIAPVASTPGVQEAAQEKVLKQSEVNELVGRVKHEAYTKGMRDAQTQPTQQPLPNGQPAGQSMGGMPQLTEEQVRGLISDEAQKQAHLTAAHNTLNNFVQQMGAGKGKYSDFDETVANLGDMKSIPHVVELAAGTGIAGDVMYELGKNPGKVASLTTLAYINPHLAKVEMQKLSDSIKKNQAESDSPNVNEPLSRMQPSVKAGADNGSKTVHDLRKMSWARG